MRSSRTLSIQVAREILGYSLLGFFLIACLLLGQNLMRRLDDMMMLGLTGSEFRAVLACLIPMLTSYALPLAFLFGALVALRGGPRVRTVAAVDGERRQLPALRTGKRLAGGAVPQHRG